MESLHIIATAENGKITIEVPEALNGKEFDITVIEKNNQFNPSKLTGEERLQRLMQFAGTAKYPDTSIDKYEWYEQAGDY